MTRRRIILSFLLLTIILVRIVPHWGEAYSFYFYPYLSATFSAISSIVPFSLDEWIVVTSVGGMIILPFYLRKKCYSRKSVVFIEVEIALWIVAWFYIGWGMNYFRDSIYMRAQKVRTEVDKDKFKTFLSDYTDSLNTTYMTVNTVDTKKVIKEIKAQYMRMQAQYGLAVPHEWQKPKVLCFNKLYSCVGVLGYIGPFASESHLNNLLFPVQYPFVYAHELSHLLSVSSEAEANYWAYVTCIHSNDTTIRYAGYYGLLPNVFRNARNILTEKEFEDWRKSVKPQIFEDLFRQQEFWRDQYSKILGEIQDMMLNALLKGNNISDGTKNYDQVLSVIMSCGDKPF